MTAAELFIGNIHKFSVSELMDIKKGSEAILDKDGMEAEVRKIKKDSGNLQAVKYVRERTQWDLKECMKYCNDL